MKRPCPQLIISDPLLVEELYISKNKFVDKDEKTKLFFKDLTGESIVFISSTEQWSIKRKILSQAFYKDKMIKMLDVIT
jgi:hypothetical protein